MSDSEGIITMTEYEKIYHSAKRPVDLWTNYLYYNFSMRFVWLIRKTKITPNQLTILSLIVATIGCFGFALGTRKMVIAGLVLVQISYVIDCADGQQARYKQQFSAFGGWLDQMSDRTKEFLVYFSLAYGYTRLHAGASIWAFAMTGLFALYLLEYYGQIMKTYRPKIVQAYQTKLNGQSRQTSQVGSHSQSGQVYQAMQQSGQSGQAGADRNIPDLNLGESGEGTGGTGEVQQGSTFTTLRKIRRIIPFHGFHIGEQYAAMLFFVAFNAIYPFFVFVACLGILMDIYRPMVDFMKLRRGAE
jgi:archaetidylinositol phosphate synthase